MLNHRLLLPNTSWIARLKHFGVRGDIAAGLTGALLAIPQAIALAALAGMPPVYGIYASLLPLLIAALWGSSWLAIGGTNTAMAMLLMAAVASMAEPGSQQYIAIALVLTLMTGIIQLLIGMMGLGKVLDFISSTVIAALTMAVAISMMVAIIPDAVGSEVSTSGSVVRQLLDLPNVLSMASPPAFIISLLTLVCGLSLQRVVPRFAFLISILMGTVAYWIANVFWHDWMAHVVLLEEVSFNLLSFALPDISLIPNDEDSILHLLASAFSLALLGMTQAIVIARSLSRSNGQKVEVDREVVGQGMSNITAGFFSGFAVSSSFSSSAVNRFSGANTPFAAVVSVIFIGLIGLFAAKYLTLIPVAVISGGLMLIAVSMFKPHVVKTFQHPRHEFIVFLMTLLTALGFGLIPGVIAGVVLSTLVYLWLTAHPQIHVEEQVANDGRPIHVITIDGSLFFGAVQTVENTLRRWTHRHGAPSILLIRTDHISYIDVPGVRLLVEEAERRILKGGDFYLYVVRDSIYQQLEQSNLLPLIGKEHVIRPNMPHPMNAVLFPSTIVRTPLFIESVLKTLKYPYQPCPSWIQDEVTLELYIERDKKVLRSLIRHFKTLRLFSPLSTDQLSELLCTTTLYISQSGDTIASSNDPLKQILIVLSGELQLGTPQSSRSLHYHRTLFAGEQQSIIAPTFVPEQSLEIMAVQQSHYLLMDQKLLNKSLDWSALQPEERTGSVLGLLSADILEAVKGKMQQKRVKAGELIIKQGDASNYFYILLQGEAVVSRHNLMDGNIHTITRLVAGDSFGEEGLLQSSSRNADVRMQTKGEISLLSKDDFNELLRPVMVPDISAEEAIKKVESGLAQWLDCRFELETINGVLPDALSIPINQVRQNTHKLDLDKHYMVYSQTGYRSRAATFLLRERSINAYNLEEGLQGEKVQALMVHFGED